MKWLDRILVCLYVALAALPYVAMKRHWQDHATWGRLPPTPRPLPTFTTFRDESYQQAYTAWFESRLGLKGYSIATDSSILFHVFGETKPGFPVIVGDDGVLFHQEDLGQYNKSDVWIPQQAAVDALADRMLAMQQRLLAEHRAFVPVITPSKTGIYRDKIPWARRRPLGEPRPSDTGMYEPLVRALEARHVQFVDARALLATSGLPREALWGHYARHWSHFGACLVMREVAQRYKALLGRDLFYDCTLSSSPAVLDDDDFDLLQLLNIWHLPALPATVPAATHSPPPPVDGPRPSVMFVGTSFCWNLVRDAEKSGVFGPIYFDYYDRTLISPDGKQAPVTPGTPEWREAFLQRDLYVFDMLEDYLFPPDGTAYLDFLRPIETEPAR